MFQVCPLLMDGKSFKVVYGSTLKSPYAYETNGTLWISYEDPDSVIAKVRLAHCSNRVNMCNGSESLLATMCVSRFGHIVTIRDDCLRP